MSFWAHPGLRQWWVSVLRENAADKARRYLGEGRLIIRSCGPGRVEAICRGDGAVHHLGYERGAWWCTCEAMTSQCSHLRACRMVTAPDL